jgi:hypothetical protein
MDTGYRMLDTGYWMLDTGCWILDAGYWMLDTGYWMLDTGCWILDAGYWILDAGYWTPHKAGQVIGYWILDKRRPFIFTSDSYRIPDLQIFKFAFGNIFLNNEILSSKISVHSC